MSDLTDRDILRDDLDWFEKGVPIEGGDSPTERMDRIVEAARLVADGRVVVAPPCPTCYGSGLPQPFRPDMIDYEALPTSEQSCSVCRGSDPDTIVYLHRASDSDMYQQLVAPRICERLSHHDVGCGWFVLDALTGDTE